MTEEAKTGLGGSSFQASDRTVGHRADSQEKRPPRRHFVRRRCAEHCIISRLLLSSRGSQTSRTVRPLAQKSSSPFPLFLPRWEKFHVAIFRSVYGAVRRGNFSLGSEARLSRNRRPSSFFSGTALIEKKLLRQTSRRAVVRTDGWTGGWTGS